MQRFTSLARVARPALQAHLARPAPQVLRSGASLRFYAASAGLSKEQIQERVLEVLKTFEKVDPAKVSNSSSFTSDLGLDSLDAVEVVMAIEEEFAIEISDEDADRITTVGQAIDYVSKTPEAH